MKQQAAGGVAGERRLEERLREYPELRARFEEMLAIVENADGTVVKADEAEERVVQELRQLGRSAVQSWAERKQRRLQTEYEGRVGVSRKVKKTSIGTRGSGRSS
jgi:hypothetical protein